MTQNSFTICQFYQNLQVLGINPKTSKPRVSECGDRNIIEVLSISKKRKEEEVEDKKIDSENVFKNLMGPRKIGGVLTNNS